MKYKVLEEEIPYTGRELRSGWVRERTGLEGDAAVVFVGHCRVETADLVDMDDARAGSTIESASMVHVIVEHPDCGLRSGVLRQRLLVCLLCELLREKGCEVLRDGDDVYCRGKKLTVSIAAPSKRSTLIHLGVNIDAAGAPVPAIGLGELDIDARALLHELLRRYSGELASCGHAEEKVRSVP